MRFICFTGRDKVKILTRCVKWVLKVSEGIFDSFGVDGIYAEAKW